MSDRIDFTAIDPTADKEAFASRVARIASAAAARGVRPTLSMQLAALWRLAIPAAVAAAVIVWVVSLAQTRPRPRPRAADALLAWAERGDAESTRVLLASLEEVPNEN